MWSRTKDTWLKRGLCDKWRRRLKFGPGQGIHVYVQQWIFIFIYFIWKRKHITIIITIIDWIQSLIGYDISLFSLWVDRVLVYICTFIDGIFSFTSCLLQLIAFSLIVFSVCEVCNLEEELITWIFFSLVTMTINKG